MARTRASDFENKKRAILIKAAAVFASNGMDKASMSLIASHAGVSKALLYHYYPNKEELIFAIILGHLEDLDNDLAAADKDEDMAPELRLNRLIRAVLNNYNHAEDKHKVQLNALSGLSESQRAVINYVEKRIIRRFYKVLVDLNPDLAADDDPRLMPLTMSIFGITNWVYLWLREDGAMSRDDFADFASDLIINGIGGRK